MKNETIAGSDEILRSKLHCKQTTTEADIASIVLWVKGTNSKICLQLGSDGYGKIAVIKNKEEIPSYYQVTDLVLNGAFKIMAYDCSKNYDDLGIEIEDDYIQVFRSGSSYILLLSK